MATSNHSAPPTRPSGSNGRSSTAEPAMAPARTKTGVSRRAFWPIIVCSGGFLPSGRPARRWATCDEALTKAVADLLSPWSCSPSSCACSSSSAAAACTR
ncbi:hypothetical protein PVAP13_3NG242801 [Panicum virgatum]|uniref:Uncharacterized protein n=1 Tax=Panicum virgatum TaxID=38727 RepID=A0A8T0ULX1_PANVG|nr:hypothetical protein PVAP13_3NG242801 [Panicum virgatum]